MSSDGANTSVIEVLRELGTLFMLKLDAAIALLTTIEVNTRPKK